MSIQNSWGDDWGQSGFGHLSYDDWFENGYDCWVARLGVKTRSLAADQAGGPLGRAMAFDYVPHSEVVLADIKPHFINLGNDGRLSQSGRYQTSEQDLDDIIARIEAQKASSGAAQDILLYAHGGLNDEKSFASRIASLLPYFVGNAITRCTSCGRPGSRTRSAALSRMRAATGDSVACGTRRRIAFWI